MLDKQRITLLGALGDALTNAGRWGEAAKLRLALASEVVEPVRTMQLRTVAAEQFLCSGRFDTGVGVLEDVLRAVHVYVPKSPLTTLIALLFARVVLRLRGLKCDLRESDLPGDVAVRIDPLLAAGYGFSMTDNALGCYFNTRALIRALRCGDPERVLRALSMEVGVSSSEGVTAQRAARRLLDRLRDLADTVDTSFGRAMVIAMTGFYSYFIHQDYPSAKSCFMTSQKMFGEQCVGQLFTRTTMRTMCFRAMTYLGDREEARAAGRRVAPGDGASRRSLRSHESPDRAPRMAPAHGRPARPLAA